MDIFAGVGIFFTHAWQTPVIISRVLVWQNVRCVVNDVIYLYILLLEKGISTPLIVIWLNKRTN